jgi:EthD domain
MSRTAAKQTYKVVILIKAAESASPETLNHQWITAPVPVWPSGLQGYFHSIAAHEDVPIENAPPAPFDAIEEFLFDDISDAVAFFGSGEFSNGWLAPRRHLLGGPMLSISGPAISVWEGDTQPADDTVKIITLPVRKVGMSRDGFAYHWIETHAGLALSGPGTRDRLVRLVSTVNDDHVFGPVKSAPFDGAGIVQFASREGFQTEFASDHYHEILAPDEPRFTDPLRSRAMIVSESAIYGRP